jgi:hypothetical protein
MSNDKWFDLQITCKQSITEIQASPVAVAVHALELAGYSVIYSEAQQVLVPAEDDDDSL